MAIEVTATSRWPAARRRLARGTFRTAWLAVGLLAALYLFVGTLPVGVRWAALLATVLLLGLPHGALDHLTVPRALGRDPTPRLLAAFAAAYLAVAGAYAVAWFLAPAASFAAFVALTWFHWGQGDLYPLVVLTDGDHLGGRGVRALIVVVRGGLPMLVPLLAFPGRYRAVAGTVVGLFDRDASVLAPLFRADVRLALGAAFVGLTVLALWLGYRRVGSRRSWLVDAGETALLGLYFAVVPPVLAIGVYFAAWHSLRHVVRVVALDDVSVAALDRGDHGRVLRRFVRDAAPTTLGALALFGALAVVVPAGPTSIPDLGGVYLVVLAVLTLPHVLVVTWLDHRQGLW